MKINLQRLYGMARHMDYEDFEHMLKKTISKTPITEKVEGDLECHITLKK